MIFISNLAMVIDKYNKYFKIISKKRINLLALDEFKEHITSFQNEFERIRVNLNEANIIPYDSSAAPKKSLDKLLERALKKISSPKFHGKDKTYYDKAPPALLEELYEKFDNRTYGLKIRQIARIITELLINFGLTLNKETIHSKITKISKNA